MDVEKWLKDNRHRINLLTVAREAEVSYSGLRDFLHDRREGLTEDAIKKLKKWITEKFILPK
jgi:hypothetical protein